MKLLNGAPLTIIIRSWKVDSQGIFNNVRVIFTSYFEGVFFLILVGFVALVAASVSILKPKIIAGPGARWRCPPFGRNPLRAAGTANFSSKDTPGG